MGLTGMICVQVDLVGKAIAESQVLSDEHRPLAYIFGVVTLLHAIRIVLMVWLHRGHTISEFP